MGTENMKLNRKCHSNSMLRLTAGGACDIKQLSRLPNLLQQQWPFEFCVVDNSFLNTGFAFSYAIEKKNNVPET
jgi:hypothetical protein